MNSTKLKNVYICFPGGKHKVLTMSYDDGREEDRQLISIFNKYGIKGTFHINSGLTQDQRILKSEWKELYAGHEVASHTYTHPTIARCPMEQVVAQIVEDRKKLEEAVGYPVRGLSYPNGSLSDEIIQLLPSLGIEYARTVGSTDDYGMPEHYLKWTATCHHTHNLLAHGKEFLGMHKTQYLYMLYVWGHSYEFTRDNNWNLMEDFCNMMSCQDDIWYATNIQIVDYMKAAKNLKFGVNADMVYNPSYQSVWLEVDGRHVEVKGGSLIQI